MEARFMKGRSKLVSSAMSCFLVVALIFTLVPITKRSASAEEVGAQAQSYPETFLVRDNRLSEVPDGWTGIYTVEDLRAIEPGGSYILMNDLDLSSWGNWDPLFGDDYPKFVGNLNGNGFAIRNMVIDTRNTDTLSQTKAIGLFGRMGVSAHIENLGLDNFSIYIDVDTPTYYFGGLVGCVTSSGGDSGAAIKNCYVKGTMVSDTTVASPYSGGLCGYVELGQNCLNDLYNTATISIKRGTVGGICGYMGPSTSNSDTLRCANFGNVSNGRGVAGGIIGNAQSDYYAGTNTEKCFNAGSVTASNDGSTAYAGGIIGSYGGNSSLSDCFNVGDVTATGLSGQSAGAGGIAGTNLLFSSCDSVYSTGAIVSTSDGSSAYADPLIPYSANRSGLTVNAAYHFQEAPTVGDPYGGSKALDAEQMMTAASFQGFNFDAVWRMGSDDYAYPVLQFLPVDMEMLLVEESKPEQPQLEDVPVYFNTTTGVERDSEDFDGENIKTGEKWVDREVSVKWGDALFSDPATTYKHDLARLGAALSSMAYAEGRHINSSPIGTVITSVEENRTQQVRFDLLYNPLEGGSYVYRTLCDTGGMGFSYENVAEYYYRDDERIDDNDTCAYTLAVKEIDSSGQKVPLVMVIIRGTAANAEWVSNANVADTSQKADTFHEGFLFASEEINVQIKKFLDQKGVSKGDAKFFVTGHSRGASVANLVAAGLSSDEGKEEDVYAYTFAAPNCVLKSELEKRNHENIFNIVNPEDVVTRVPLSQWDYGRYGITLCTPSSSNAAEFNTRYRGEVRQYFGEYTNGVLYDPFPMGAMFSKNAATAVYALCRSVPKYYEILFGIPPTLTLNPITKKLLNDFGLTSREKITSLNAVIEAFLKEEHVGWDSLNPREQLAHRYGAELLDYYEKVGIIALGLAAVIGGLGFVVAAVGVGGVIYNYAVSTAPRVVHAHTSETYLSWMMELDSVAMYRNRYKGITVACPVDVYVKDASGNLVVKIEDDIVDEKVMETGLPAFVDEDGVKHVDIPDDGTYSVEIVATENGAMDYFVEEFDGEGSTLRQVNFCDIALANGEKFEGVITEGEGNAASSFSLSTSRGETIEPDGEYAGEDVDNIAVSVTASGNGNAWGNALVTNGKNVSVTAEPFEGAKLKGWYEEGILVSEEAKYSFRANKDRDLIAVFEDVPLSDVGGDNDKEGGGNDATQVKSEETLDNELAPAGDSALPCAIAYGAGLIALLLCGIALRRVRRSKRY